MSATGRAGVALAGLMLAGCFKPYFTGFKEGASTVAEGKPTEAFPKSFGGGTYVPTAPQTGVAQGGWSAPPPTAVPTAALGPGPRRGAPQPNTYALIVGIERYRDVAPPPGARSDAERFAELARRSLGVPEANLRVALDDRATKSDVEKHLAWLQSNVPEGARVYFFFAGHGSPEATTGEAYLLPADVDPKFVTATGLALDGVLASLGRTRAKEVVAFVDACFSGAGPRSVLAPGIRPLVRVVDPKPAQQVAVFASAQANETSGPAPGLPVGLFTHVLVQALGSGAADVDGDGNVSLEELRQWVPPRVTREAAKDNRAQHPVLSLGPGIGNPERVWVAAGLE